MAEAKGILLAARIVPASYYVFLWFSHVHLASIHPRRIISANK